MPISRKRSRNEQTLEEQALQTERAKRRRKLEASNSSLHQEDILMEEPDMPSQNSTDNPASLEDMPSVIINTVFQIANSEEEQGVLSRVFFEIPKGVWNPASGLFGSVELRAEGLKKALGHELITGNIIKAEVLLKQNLWLFNEKVEGTDHCGRTLKEKPIAFVAKLYDLNPRGNEVRDFGAVERLSKMAIESGRLTRDEIGRQINEVLPCHWNEMTDEGMLHYGLDPNERDLLCSQHEFPWQALTAKHMQKYKNACETLVEDIAAIEIPSGIRWEQTLTLPAVQAAAERFRAAIQSKENQPTGSLIFDPAIFFWFAEQFSEDRRQPGWATLLGGAHSWKSNLLLVLGYGGLQFHNTASGLQLDRVGMDLVIFSHCTISRLMNFSAGVPADLSLLGSSETLDGYGDRVHWMQSYLPPPYLFQKLCKTKTSSLSQYVPQNCVQYVPCPKRI